MKKKIIYAGMAADIIHHGHINLIKKGAKKGNLIVGVLSDKAIESYKRKPIFTYKQRKYIIENIKGVEKVVKQNTLSYIPNLKKYKPAIVIHGDDWKKGKQKKTREDVIKCLNMAHRFALNEKAVGLINCPINKTLLKKKIGVTEYLANKSKIKENTVAMLINNQKLSVCPITTHTDLKDVASKLNKKEIVDKVITIQKWFKRRIKRKPRIAILGLNPHNAELRKNSEEKKIIIPAITKLKRLGFLVTGPMVADTLFIEEYKKFDVIIGMFHDQVLAPFKTLFKFQAINITLGLNYLRVSPDHGVAKNLILKKKANAESLTRCIDFMDKFK